MRRLLVPAAIVALCAATSCTDLTGASCLTDDRSRVRFLDAGPLMIVTGQERELRIQFGFVKEGSNPLDNGCWAEIGDQGIVTSSDPTVARVTGEIRFHDGVPSRVVRGEREGRATITATFRGQAATIPATVCDTKGFVTAPGGASCRFPTR